MPYYVFVGRKPDPANDQQVEGESSTRHNEENVRVENSSENEPEKVEAEQHESVATGESQD